MEKKAAVAYFRYPSSISAVRQDIQEHISAIGIRTRRSQALVRKASTLSVNTSYRPNPGIVIASPLRRKPARRRSRAPHPDWQRFLRENTAARSLLCQRLPYAPSNNSTTARHRLSSWLTGWLAGWHTWCLDVRLTAWLIYFLSDRLTFWLPDCSDGWYAIWQSSCPDVALTESQSGNLTNILPTFWTNA